MTRSSFRGVKTGRMGAGALTVLMGALMGALLVAGGLAIGDVVVHTGTVAGSIGLTGTTFTYGSIGISNNSFSAAASVAGDAYAITAEGDQSFTTVTWIEYATSPNESQFSFIDKSAALTVPLGGAVAADYVVAGGQLASHIVVNIDQGTGRAAGSIADASFTATATTGSRSYTAKWSGAGPDLSGGMAAAEAISVRGSATINVFDAEGNSVVCATMVAFDPVIVTLAAGNTETLTYNVTVDPSLCAAAVVKGTVGMHNVPGGVFPASARALYDQNDFGGVQNLSGFSLPTPDQHYQFDGLQKSIYRPAVYMYFPAPYLGDFLFLPNKNATVDLTNGGTEVRDFVFDGAATNGKLTLSGPPASLLTYGVEYFYGAFDPNKPNFGPTEGGFASAELDLADLTYKTILTPGNWQEYSGYLGFRQSIQGVDYLSYFYNTGQLDINAVAGQTYNIAPQNLSVAEGVVILDVAEAPGAPIVGLTNPYVAASFLDLVNVYYVTATGSTNVNHVDTPVVRLVGAPGIYDFDGFATLGGSYTKLATSKITIGKPVVTGAGANVSIVPQDHAGVATPVSVSFASVATAGQSAISITDVGPAIHGDFTLLGAIGAQRYFYLSTSAAFGGQAEVCLRYDPALLQLSPSEEAQLKLQEFTCASADQCSWQVTNGILPGHNGGRAVNTATHTICGLASSLGTFALTRANAILVPPTDTCVGLVNAPAHLRTDPNVCTTTIDNVRQSAGGCSGGGGGLASCTFDGQASEALSPGPHTVVVLGTANDGSSATCSSYVKVADRQAPAVECPPARTIECTGSTTPVPTVATCTDNCAGCTVKCGGSPLCLGNSTVACNGADNAGNKSSCTTSIKVVDTVAPRITLTASLSQLSPANHKLVGIQLIKTVTDTCDPRPRVTCTATSNEHDHHGDDGPEHRSDDMQWPSGNLLLRSERCEHHNSSGRVYTITCTARDSSGNQSSASVTVTVPRVIKVGDRDR